MKVLGFARLFCDRTCAYWEVSSSLVIRPSSFVGEREQLIFLRELQGDDRCTRNFNAGLKRMKVLGFPGYSVTGDMRRLRRVVAACHSSIIIRGWKRSVAVQNHKLSIQDWNGWKFSGYSETEHARIGTWGCMVVVGCPSCLVVRAWEQQLNSKRQAQCW